MTTTTTLSVSEARGLQMPSPAEAVIEHNDDFSNRSRIALLEEDRALRAVIVRSLLRMGCVVTFKHTLSQVKECLQRGAVHGVLVAWELSAGEMAEIDEANVNRVPVVVLTDAASPLPGASVHDSLRFLQKPFDMRDLFAQLSLVQASKISNRR